MRIISLRTWILKFVSFGSWSNGLNLEGVPSWNKLIGTLGRGAIEGTADWSVLSASVLGLIKTLKSFSSKDSPELFLVTLAGVDCEATGIWCVDKNESKLSSFPKPIVESSCYHLLLKSSSWKTSKSEAGKLLITLPK